jgi:hypothetical protein
MKQSVLRLLKVKTNQEINDILKGQNIIGFIKKQRLNWLDTSNT